MSFSCGVIAQNNLIKLNKEHDINLKQQTKMHARLKREQ